MPIENFEQAIANQVFSKNQEKTFIDKILAKQDVESVRELIKKPRLKREELLELLYLLTSTESKLLNYSEWDRYIILKYFVWIREFIKISELLFDYTDFINKKEATGRHILTDRSRELLDNCERLVEHNAKFLIDLYFNIARTTLSLGATGILELIKNKYEISYPQTANINTPMQENKSFMSKLFKGG
jgi:hypothetical protein